MISEESLAHANLSWRKNLQPENLKHRKIPTIPSDRAVCCFGVYFRVSLIIFNAL